MVTDDGLDEKVAEPCSRYQECPLHGRYIRCFNRLALKCALNIVNISGPVKHIKICSWWQITDTRLYKINHHNRVIKHLTYSHVQNVSFSPQCLRRTLIANIDIWICEQTLIE